MTETEWPDKCAKCGSDYLISPETIYIDHTRWHESTSETQIECNECGAIAYIVLDISMKSVEWKGGKKPNIEQP